MPANKKYLCTSAFRRWMKITAGFFGGYGVTISFFLMLTSFFDTSKVLMTGLFSGFIIWAILLLLAFLTKSGWKIWLVYLSLTLLFSLPYLLHSPQL
ncbi:hypothetical protein EDD80_102408 [Anseongella ginsenosidimutans]|uniref:DUF3649 domain-containing protein n=1 Tax=Anseongella ginsenosidimutans TaxID=496056 RepID=A0A4R3KW65_9SPHI|nr:hypothetical protein [Anseongella ginsenosidimutans]QEC51839.1 hypothetical protein FRZ59_05455 [Anseongella ginsenosidimutans]TCS89214.1 hypothetical protein EDD80_102408 [Anseongella ginsenosidimutans]